MPRTTTVGNAPSGLDPRMRALLLASGPINATGALIFAPPFPWVREFFGLPGGHALYLWILSAWILVFGIAYWRMGATGHVDRTFLAVGAAGKATFGLLLIALATTGQIPPSATVVGIPDLVIAAAFVAWLRRG
ncbi:MAG: hypothetical protein ABR587_00040 [Candidatus Binatia bacterium]